MHLKRLNTPKRWNIAKKTSTYVARPLSGPHKKEFSVPLIVLLREQLGLVDTRKDSLRLIHNKEILLDNSLVKSNKIPVGLFDVVSFPANKINYRMTLDVRGGLSAIKIDEKEAKQKLFNITDKTRIKNGKIQLNCSSGRNILIEKDSYKVGDSILFDLEKKKIIKHLPAKKGALVLVMFGKHAGVLATIEDFKNFKGTSKDQVILKTDKNAVYETMKEYAFVVGEKKPELKIKEGSKNE